MNFNGKLKELENRIKALEDRLEANDEHDQWIEDSIEDLWDYLKPEDDCDCCECSCDCDKCHIDYEDDEEEDITEDEDISLYAYDTYGLNSYTISDGKGAALVIPLDDYFDEDRYIKMVVVDRI